MRKNLPNHEQIESNASTEHNNKLESFASGELSQEEEITLLRQKSNLRAFLRMITDEINVASSPINLKRFKADESSGLRSRVH
jgi:hypothetical protein